MSIDLDTRQRDLRPLRQPAAPRVEVVEAIAPSLHARWGELERRSNAGTIFQSADWCRAWIEAAQAAGAAECPRIVTIWRGDRLVLLWPLAVRRLFVFRILHALAEPATQYGDLLVDPQDDVAALVQMAWSAIRSWRDIDAVQLRHVPDDTVLAQLPELARHAVDGSQGSAPLLDFRNLAVDSVDGQKSSRSRNALRRHQRQLAELGQISFEIVQRPDEQCALLAEAFVLKRQWQNEKSAMSAGYAHRASEGCLLRLAKDGHLLAARLNVGQQTAAIEIGAVRDRQYWSLVQSYDLRFAKHAPGRLLFWRLLERCPSLAIDVFDFLAPAHRHKLEWSNAEIGVRDYLLPISAKGRGAVAYLMTVKPALRNVYVRLPLGLRRRVAPLLHRLA